MRRQRKGRTVSTTASGHDVVNAQQTVLEDHALQPVPPERRQGLWRLVMVQIGWNISVSAFLVGGTIGAGVSFGTAVAAILLGNLFLSLVAIAIGLVGFRTGLTSYLISRVVFGIQGSVLVSLVLGVLAMGFIGVLMDAWGTALNLLIPAVPWTVVVLLFAAAITSTAIFGFKGLARFTVLAVPLEVAIALFALGRIAFDDEGFSAVLAAEPPSPIPFTVAVGAAIATWITGAGLVSDVDRFARRPRDVVIAGVAGFVVGAGVFETVAVISAMKVGDANFALVMQSLGLLAPAVVMLVLALWNTADNNLYSSSLAFTNASRIVGVPVPRWVWTLIAVGVSVGVAFLGFAGQFLSFLSIISVVTPPFVGVVLSHFYLVARARRTGAELLAAAPAVRVEALAAWAAAALISYNIDGFVKPVNGLLLGLVLYTAVAWVTGMLRGGRAPAAAQAAPPQPQSGREA